MVNLIHNIEIGSLTAATIVSFIVSALWYGPLFGSTWLEYSHLNQKKLEDYRNENKTEKNLIAVVCSFLTALLLLNLINLLHVNFWTDVLYLAFGLWLGWIFTSLLNDFLWSPTKKEVFFINITHHLVNLAAQGLTIYFIERKLRAL